MRTRLSSMDARPRLAGPGPRGRVILRQLFEPAGGAAIPLVRLDAAHPMPRRRPPRPGEASGNLGPQPA